MLAFACFIQKASRRASRPERSEAKQQVSNDPPSPVVNGASTTAVVARPRQRLTPLQASLQRMPEAFWSFIVRRWRTCMVLYACGSFFAARFCGEFGEPGVVSPRFSQPEFTSGSAMYLDIDAELPEVPQAWVSVPTHVAYGAIPSKAAPQKFKENDDPVVKKSRGMRTFKHAAHHEEGVASKAAPQKVKENEAPVGQKSRVMKSFKHAHHAEARSKSRSHQALVYVAMALAPLALALAFALVFATPRISTA
jgi:hypothetical protein